MSHYLMMRTKRPHSVRRSQVAVMALLDPEHSRIRVRTECQHTILGRAWRLIRKLLSWSRIYASDQDSPRRHFQLLSKKKRAKLSGSISILRTPECFPSLERKIDQAGAIGVLGAASCADASGNAECAGSATVFARRRHGLGECLVRFLS